jgi:hypothetical protein
MKALDTQIERLNRLRYPLYLITISIVILLNIIVLNQDFRRINSFKKVMPHQIIGNKFRGLNEFTKNIEFISYYTDQDLKKDLPSKEFTQAQLLLAPTVLDPDNVSHEYILLVCKNEANAWEKMKEINATPLRRNQHGTILARRIK